MALSYAIDPVEGLVTITGDYADAPEWRRLAGEISRDPDYRRGMSFIRDVREASNPETDEGILAVMQVVREVWTPLGVRAAAIVTQGKMEPRALMAFALAQDERLAVDVFTSYEDALRWLRRTREGEPGPMSDC